MSKRLHRWEDNAVALDNHTNKKSLVKGKGEIVRYLSPGKHEVRVLVNGGTDYVKGMINNEPGKAGKASTIAFLNAASASVNVLWAISYLTNTALSTAFASATLTADNKISLVYSEVDKAIGVIHKTGATDSVAGVTVEINSIVT